ncbi:hypothetical protein Tco_0786454 [Tanacetum coccineum]
MQEVVLFYNGLDVPTRQILDSRGAIPSKTVTDTKTAIQEMDEYSQNGTIEHQESEKRRDHIDHNSRKLALKPHNPYLDTDIQEKEQKES